MGFESATHSTGLLGEEEKMPRLVSAMVAFALAIGATAAIAGPDEDRLKVVNYFKNKSPDIKLDDYTYGALVFDPDARAQYDSIMEFPPFAVQLEKGKTLWQTPFKNGRTYADCLPNGGRMIAGHYPMFDARQGRVVTFENILNACREANGEAPYAYDDMDTMGRLSAYARTLSDGMRVDVKVEGEAARQAFEDGKRTYYRRVGQLNFSCASCHIEAAGNRLRSERLSPVLGQATHWPVFRAGERLVTLQNRYAGCFRQVRQVPDEINSPRFNNLEYFHTYLSNGLPMKASVFRK